MNVLKKNNLTGSKAGILFYLLLLLSCTQHAGTKKYASPPGYNLSNPVIIHLRSDLDEISGIEYYAKDNSLFAIADEAGILYKIHLQKPIVIEQWKFENKGDFEDIILKDSTFFALQSEGSLKAFSFVKSAISYTDDCTLPINGNNEFEALYYDAYNEKIVILCKDCENDNKSTITAYFFNTLEQTFSKKPFYQIDKNQLTGITNSEKLNFKPSAAAIHPLTKELYILSSVAGLLVIADTRGNVKSTFKLDRSFFKQPEGITFSPSGTLYISNESAEAGNGTILIFKYKQ